MEDTDGNLRGYEEMPSKPRLAVAHIDLLEVRDRFLQLPMLGLEGVPEPRALVIAVKVRV